MPVMSDGIRSGVNWMRLKATSRIWADRRDHERLGQARHADQQAMPAGEDGGEDLLDDVRLADDDAPQLLDHLSPRLRELGQVFADAVGLHGALSFGKSGNRQYCRGGAVLHHFIFSHAELGHEQDGLRCNPRSGAVQSILAAFRSKCWPERNLLRCIAPRAAKIEIRFGGRTSQAQLVEARTKVEVQRTEAKTWAEALRLRRTPKPRASGRKRRPNRRRLRNERKPRRRTAHSTLLRLEKLAALRELGRNANARI